MSYNTTIVADSAWRYWLLADSSTTVIDEYIAGSPDGTASTTTSLYSTTSPPGLQSNSINFNGSSFYITFPDNDKWSPASTNMSVEIWCRPEANSVMRVIGKNLEWGLGYGEGGGTNQFYCFIQKSDGNMCKYAIESGTSSLNTWYHIVMVWNGTTLKLYKDGADVTSLAADNSVDTLSNSSATVYMGTHSSSQYWDGQLKNMALYDSAISGSVISSHYSLGSGVVSVSADVTDIDIAGQDATVTAGTDLTVSADVTDIDITGYDATVTAESPNAEITADVTDIDIAGQSATITTTYGVEITADVSDIAVSGKAADYTIIFQDYENQITADAPKIWYKWSNTLDNSGSLGFTAALTSASPGSISYGSTDPLTGTSTDVYANTFTDIRVNTVRTMGMYLPTTTSGGATEFWVRTTSTATGAIVSIAQPSGSSTLLTYGQVFNTTDGKAAYYGSGNRATIYGCVNGYLSIGKFQSSQTVDFGQPIPNTVVWTNSGSYIADGNWHHIVLNVVKTGSTLTLKTYVDAVEAITNIAVYNYLSDSASAIMVFGDLNGAFTGDFSETKQIVPKLNMDLDEFAIYSSGLSASRVLAHYNAGYGTTSSDPDVNIDVDSADIAVAGVAATPQISLTYSVPDAGQINVDSYATIIDPGIGSRLLGSDITNIAITGHDAVAGGERSIEIALDDNPADIAVETIGLTSILATNNDIVFDFVPSDTIALTARDATSLGPIDLGAFLFSQSKTTKFKIANLSSFIVGYTLSIVSSNAEIIPNVLLSLDDETYSTSVSFENVQPNSITPTIWLKLEVPAGLSTGDGNFLINVEGTYVGN